MNDLTRRGEYVCSSSTKNKKSQNVIFSNFSFALVEFYQCPLKEVRHKSKINYRFY